MDIEKIGKIVAFGWGDRVLRGFIPEYLGLISLDKCHEYIRDNKDLLAGVSEKDWSILRKIARAAKIDLTMKEVVTELQQSRPDVLSIIINTPGGNDWLNTQIENAREKLGY